MKIIMFSKKFFFGKRKVREMNGTHCISILKLSLINTGIDAGDEVELSLTKTGDMPLTPVVKEGLQLKKKVGEDENESHRTEFCRRDADGGPTATQEEIS